MVQAVIARAMRGLRRLPATRPQKPVALDRIPWMLARRGALHGLPTGGGGDSTDGSTSVGGGRDEPVGALGLFLCKPMDAEPLPLGVPVPVTISVPRHQATNGDGFVFSVEATCNSLCELYTPVAAAHARDVIVASAQEAAKAEMVQGGWNYESIYLGSTKELAMERFAERVLARMVSSARSSGDDSSTAIVFTNYNVTTLLLDPAATLAFAATQYLDPAIRLVAAACAELVRQIRMDGAGHMRTTQERLEEASKAMSSFVKVFGADKPTPPPQRRSWILGLFQFIIAFVLALSVGLLGYSHFFPEQWAAKSDAVIQGYANSFRYYASGGYMGETLVQRHKRLLAEAERQLQEEKRKKAEELKRLKREEERLKKLEERRRKEEAYEVWRRAEAHAEQLMTPLQSPLQALPPAIA